MATRRKKAPTDADAQAAPPKGAPAPVGDALGAMKFTHTRLLVADMTACYRFYRDTLGLHPRFDAEGSVYAEFDFGTGGHTLALFSRELMNKVSSPGAPAHRPGDAVPFDSVVVTFEVADVDDTCARLKARGVTLTTEPHDQRDWMLRVAHFRDPDGHLIEVNQPLQA
jgi:catechol 2,3-dioxygenase-like lactoylglutathione lyase family enzyme